MTPEQATDIAVQHLKAAIAKNKIGNLEIALRTLLVETHENQRNKQVVTLWRAHLKKHGEVSLGAAARIWDKVLRKLSK